MRGRPSGDPVGVDRSGKEGVPGSGDRHVIGAPCSTGTNSDDELNPRGRTLEECRMKRAEMIPGVVEAPAKQGDPHDPKNDSIAGRTAATLSVK